MCILSLMLSLCLTRNVLTLCRVSPFSVWPRPDTWRCISKYSAFETFRHLGTRMGQDTDKLKHVLFLLSDSLISVYCLWQVPHLDNRRLKQNYMYCGIPSQMCLEAGHQISALLPLLVFLPIIFGGINLSLDT